MNNETEMKCPDCRSPRPNLHPSASGYQWFDPESGWCSDVRICPNTFHVPASTGGTGSGGGSNAPKPFPFDTASSGSTQRQGTSGGIGGGGGGN